MSMPDGYYLAVYMHIEGLSYLLQTSHRHDQNMALFVKSGNRIELLRYWEFERSTGIKMHKLAFFSVEQAKRYLNLLLSEVGLTLNEMVEIWGVPQLAKSNWTLTPHQELSIHSVLHLYSSLLSDTRKFHQGPIVGLSADCSPDGLLDPAECEKYYYCGCYKDGDTFDLFPVSSPGFYWWLAKKKFKMREGTLMALATASSSKANGSPCQAPEVKNKHSFAGARAFFDELVDRIFAFTERNEGKEFNCFDSRFSILENKISMVMKEIQTLSNAMMEQNIRRIIERYNLNPADAHLAVAGGYFLNCPGNSHLLETFRFKGMIAPPCVSDCGLSLGIGLYAFHLRYKDDWQFSLKHAYYGYREDQVMDGIRLNAFHPYIDSVRECTAQAIAAEIAAAPVIWFNGPAEIGPRALGNRSLLADPRFESSKERLNLVKNREWWRPVAPIVLEEFAADWFEDSYPSPYMLNTFKIREVKRHLIPAIAHLDGTARVQTLNRDANPILYDVILAFYRLTGIPIVCNTSLNDSAEPIIDRMEQALNFALRKGFDKLYVNLAEIRLRNQESFPETAPAARVFTMNSLDETEREALLRIHNPHGIPEHVLKSYKQRYEFFYQFAFDPAREHHAETIKRIVQLNAKSAI